MVRESKKNQFKNKKKGSGAQVNSTGGHEESKDAEGTMGAIQAEVSSLRAQVAELTSHASQMNATRGIDSPEYLQFSSLPHSHDPNVVNSVVNSVVNMIVSTDVSQGYVHSPIEQITFERATTTPR
jgi:hypothetical protein